MFSRIFFACVLKMLGAISSSNFNSITLFTFKKIKIINTHVCPTFFFFTRCKIFRRTICYYCQWVYWYMGKKQVCLYAYLTPIQPCVMKANSFLSFILFFQCSTILYVAYPMLVFLWSSHKATITFPSNKTSLATLPFY